ncbi:synaptonemal complex protein 2-like [Argentina anserina]|uniref:synaptonemal complex protein 2-like n=1 Tax=Argentina anserina TaxID=57926 RepID=UPI0021767453|nr:synaptonemal complex protein 2-like [Potentilla anserina]
MQKLGFPSMRSLDQFKSLSKSASGAPPKTFAAYSSRPPESTSSGSFANLKLTAEKLVKEQASVKTDLEMANTKLKKSMDHIRVLEEKLQNAFNENAKFKVKQKEDEKLWKGLESKFSSTKTLCDQLTETLQLLASQVQDAEKDREFLEGKLSASSIALDGLSQQMNDLTIKLESSEETIRNREKELQEHRLEKEETDKLYRNEQCRTANLIEEKDNMIKNFEETLATNRLATESLNTKLGEVHLELKLKEDEIRRLKAAQENLETEKHNLHLSKDTLVKKLDVSVLEIKNLEGFVHLLTARLTELDRQSLIFVEKFDKLNSLYEACFQLVNQERDLSAKLAQRQYDQLHNRFLNLTSEKDAIKMVNQELNNRVMELQKVQEAIMEQLTEESRTARERIQKLEFETEILISKKIETEKLVSELELQIDYLSESSRSSENKMQDLLIKLSALETENKGNTEKLQVEIQKKEEQIDGLLKDGETHEQHVDLMNKQVSQLHSTLEEKEQLIVQYKELEKNLEEQITENRASLTAAETRLVEDKKQYDLMLESKQLELSRHLKDISQRNDQAINDIRRKYEVEKLEIINMEKQKAENLVREREIECEKKLEECKEESRQHLIRIQEEHAALVSNLQHEHDDKERSLKAKHSEELKQIQLQAENELREKVTLMRNEHEAQLRALRLQHEDEIKKLQEDLDLQKTKEEKQRALLQLQWKVMSDNPEEEQELNSKKEYSISSRRNPVRRRGQRSLRRQEHDKKDSPLVGATHTPVSTLLKKASENMNSPSVMNISKHHNKVIRDEYEVETGNGRTIKRKTRSTVMYEDPRKHKRTNTPKVKSPRSVVKGSKGENQPRPSNIGDLFSEGSLNPYADDPYAFD